MHANKKPLLFNGCGVNVFWQLGVVQQMQDVFRDDKHRAYLGISAGSIAAVFHACKVDTARAISLALAISQSFRLHERRFGLIGLFGTLVRCWLVCVLPDSCADMCNGRVHIGVKAARNAFRTSWHSSFSSKQDLIDAIMASCHIPFLIDGRLFATFNGMWCVDGCLFDPLLATRVIAHHGAQLICPSLDERVSCKWVLSFQHMQWIWDLFHMGRSWNGTTLPQ